MIRSISVSLKELSFLIFLLNPLTSVMIALKFNHLDYYKLINVLELDEIIYFILSNYHFFNKDSNLDFKYHILKFTHFHLSPQVNIYPTMISQKKLVFHQNK